MWFVILFEGFFSCALFAATHVWIRPRLSPSSPSTLRATAAFRGFRRRTGCNLCHLTPEMAHSRRANHRSSKLGPIFCKRRGLGVLSLKYVKWLQYVCAYCIVYSMVLKWCIMMHYCIITLWCIIMMYYDSLWFIAIDYDSLWFISWWFFFAVLPKIYRYIGWVVLLPRMPVTTRIIIYFSR